MGVSKNAENMIEIFSASVSLDPFKRPKASRLVDTNVTKKRRVFKMSDSDYQRMLLECDPGLVQMDGRPTVQARLNSNRFWHALSNQLGFEWMTVRSIPQSDPRFFTAVPVEDFEKRFKQQVQYVNLAEEWDDEFRKKINRRT